MEYCSLKQRSSIISAQQALAFQSGNYLGEDSNSKCSFSLEQLEKVIKIKNLYCENKTLGIRLSSVEQNYYLGNFSINDTNASGKKFNYIGKISNELISYTVYQEGLANPVKHELYEHVAENEIHIVYSMSDIQNTENSWFDMVVVRQ
jgi:hypothetical protein